MTTGGKVALLGGLAALAGGAYYFLVVRKNQPQSLLTTQANAQGSSSSPSTAAQSTGSPASQPQLTQAQMIAAQYEGRVIRADQEPAVYLIKDGIRHGFLSPDALRRAGFDFPQVVSVPKAIVMQIPEGSHISGLSGINTLALR